MKHAVLFLCVLVVFVAGMLPAADQSGSVPAPDLKPAARQSSSKEDPAATKKDAPQAEPSTSEATKKEKQELPRELFTGKVVMLREALERRGIPATKEIDKQVVLETPAGALIPIVPDWRGRAFFQDEKLRGRKVELVGYRRPGVPYLQVLMVFTFDGKGARQYTDYWCDICSIPMYEIKHCDCCQGPVRLRYQPGELPEYLKKPQ